MQELKTCDMKIDIIRFVVKGCAKLSVPPNRLKQIHIGSRSVAPRRVYSIPAELILEQIFWKTHANAL